jgi:hypothetical protein
MNASLDMIILFYSITSIFGEFAITKAETSPCQYHTYATKEFILFTE